MTHMARLPGCWRVPGYPVGSIARLPGWWLASAFRFPALCLDNACAYKTQQKMVNCDRYDQCPMHVSVQYYPVPRLELFVRLPGCQYCPVTRSELLTSSAPLTRLATMPGIARLLADHALTAAQSC